MGGQTKGRRDAAAGEETWRSGGERGGHKGKEGVSIVLAERNPQAQYT